MGAAIRRRSPGVGDTIWGPGRVRVLNAQSPCPVGAALSSPSPGLYPKLPADPLPSDPHGGGGVYPPPRPRPQPPRPRPQPSDTNGFGGSGGYGGYSGGHDTHGGGHGPTHHGDDVGGAQGNTVARIVSPIVSVVVVALVGAGVSYFRSGQRRGCLGRSDPETI
ncbi:glycoprotein Xg isoform X5 [Alexandromys fortis]|uniref:glycoprotein Xg isoform X5 n=1 Tax=Alexandromys fortis TaxID=100897 RepID=UPI00215273AD|nr:glycoprotein Xg isoform X5 [Microtus fortis]XP_049989078.1 glycoprotein Xg isoform X5 [Microtus fortis]